MWEWVRRAVLHSLSTALLRLWKWLRAFWYKNGLLTLSMLSVVTGCLLGFLLRALELTDLVSLAGMVTGVRGMEWVRGQALVPVRVPDGHLVPVRVPEARAPAQEKHLKAGFCPWLFSLFSFLSLFPKKVPTNAQAIGHILLPSDESGELWAGPHGAAGARGGMRMGKGGMFTQGLDAQ